MEKDFTLLLSRDQAMIEERLAEIFRDETRYADLQEAMEYSLLAGGKRIRPVLTLETCRMCGGSLQAALELAAGTEDDKLWVIGGGSVYTALLHKCRRVYLTKVDAAADNADTFFPNLDKLPGWKIEAVSEPVEENGLTYRFIDYINTKL